MHYQSGHIGRVFLAKMEHGDDILLQLERLVAAEEVESAFFLLLGAVGAAQLVVGPEAMTIPPIPVWRQLADGREVLGAGTVFRNPEGKPVLHLHAALGRGDSVQLGCARRQLEAYLVAEVVLLELVGLDARRIPDPDLGVEVLDLSAGSVRRE